VPKSEKRVPSCKKGSVMWGMAKVGGIAALRLFHITGSATQRVLQRKPVAAFLGGGIVLDNGALLDVGAKTAAGAARRRRDE
jgi:hypothetical protein